MVRTSAAEPLARDTLDRDGALVLRGVIGIGKSTLLERLAEPGATVLRTAGVEAESHLPYGALDRLLRPIAATLDSPRFKEILHGDTGCQPFAAGADLVTMLPRLAPVTCLVDDAHWLDPESADTLRYTARRLPAEGARLIFAAEPEFAAPGLPDLHLDGVSPDEAAQVLARFEIADPIRDWLIGEAHGNPLALTEFAAAMSPDQRLGLVRKPDVPCVTTRVLAHFGHRMAGLSAEARTLLTLVSAEIAGDLATVMSAAGKLEVAEEALAEAEEFAQVTGLRVRFRHPLARSAAYYLTSLPERLRVHRVLAEVAAEPLERLRHQRAATTTPDERLAAELEKLAGRADPALASCLYRDAAQLSTEEGTRRRRQRASGTPGSVLVDPLAALTPQERRIVSLAAHGASNRDIAKRLVLSPRTVEYHLYKAYPKLGVTSRWQLRNVLAES